MGRAGESHKEHPRSRRGVASAVGGLKGPAGGPEGSRGGGEVPSRVGPRDLVNGDVSAGGVLSSQTTCGI